VRLAPPATSATLLEFTTAYAAGPTSAAPRGAKPSAGVFVVTAPADVTLRRELAAWSATMAALTDASQRIMFDMPIAATVPTPSTFPDTPFPATKETVSVARESARTRYPVFSFVYSVAPSGESVTPKGCVSVAERKGPSAPPAAPEAFPATRDVTHVEPSYSNSWPPVHAARHTHDCGGALAPAHA
jgi:hypothetical protein